jgi:threonine/homoserine/homoserine lactone efflux protein
MLLFLKNDCFFLKALVIGISIAAIIGPISLYFINKTIQDGVRSAVAIALGASLADGVYCIIAAFGLSSISQFISQYSAILKIFGGLFLLYIAYSEIRKDQVNSSVKIDNPNHLMIKIFFLTLSSPVTIASFIAIFATIGSENITISHAIVMAAGCIIGSIIWWVILGAILLKTRDKLKPATIKKIRFVSSAIIAIFGLVSIGSSIF